MIDSLRSWFAGLSSREKVLITILLVLLAGFIAFYGIMKPFSGAIEGAQNRYQEAIERQARIQTKVAFFQTAKEVSGSSRQTRTGSIEAIIRQSAGEAGFATSAITSQSDGSVTMTIDSAKPTVFFRWVATLEQRGITVSEISANPGSNEAIRATLTLQ